MKYDPVITADDVIRAGACRSGVAKVVHRLADKIAAAMPASAVMRLVRPSERQYVRTATATATANPEMVMSEMTPSLIAKLARCHADRHQTNGRDQTADMLRKLADEIERLSERAALVDELREAIREIQGALYGEGKSPSDIEKAAVRLNIALARADAARGEGG